MLLERKLDNSGKAPSHLNFLPPILRSIIHEKVPETGQSVAFLLTLEF